jgi:hypothetical protein
LELDGEDRWSASNTVSHHGRRRQPSRRSVAVEAGTIPFPNARAHSALIPDPDRPPRLSIGLLPSASGTATPAEPGDLLW